MGGGGGHPLPYLCVVQIRVFSYVYKSFSYKFLPFKLYFLGRSSDLCRKTSSFHQLFCYCFWSFGSFGFFSYIIWILIGIFRNLKLQMITLFIEPIKIFLTSFLTNQCQIYLYLQIIQSSRLFLDKSTNLWKKQTKLGPIVLFIVKSFSIFLHSTHV